MRIKAAHLVSRLHEHALGEVDMSPTQIKAAEILLRKVAPDLARQEVTGEDGKPQEMTISWKEPK